ncbi:TonB-dependent receptor [Coralloluteibacterium thermophilus]|uniref:TonB-dependent receptor n=1 Tax=Coralloluteibacterium thermophilum TaxID=2707049 RepID=A0ABV9NEH3_9GAMM
MRRQLALAIALALPSAFSGHADAAPPEAVAAAIPAQPLDQALAAFARDSGLQLVYAAELAAGRQTRGTPAGLPPQEALERLLAGTGLTYRYINARTVTIQPAAAPDAGAAPTMPAQSDARPAMAPIHELDRIEVLGSYAGALSAALAEKRYADSVVDAIAAEDIGKLPAQNVAEALQRIPGVTIERDRGEGVYVRVRGLGPGFQVTTLNGQTMAVNENVRTSGQTGRQFRYDSLPAELVSGLEVVKSPTAAMDEGAIGGIVNVRTFRPLELGRSLFSGSAELSRAQKAGENDPRVSGLFNWVSDDRRFGALLSAAYAERSLRQDRVTEVGWDHHADGVPGVAGAYYAPTGIRPTLELEERERVGAAAALQWRPTEALEIGLDALYTRQTVHYDEYTLGVGGWNPAAMRNIVVEDGAIRSFDYDTGQVQVSRETSGITDENRALRLNATWRGERWTLGATAFDARAKSWDSDPIRRTRLRTGSNVGMHVAMPRSSGRNVPDWVFTGGYDPDAPEATPGRRLEWRQIDALDRESALQFDAERGLDHAFFSDIRAGVKFRERARDYDRADLILNDGIAGTLFPADHFTRLPVSDLLSGARGNLPTSWLAPIEPRFWGDWPNAADLAGTPGAADLQNSYRVEEDIGAAYLMAGIGSTLAGRELRGNLGVRVVRTRQVTLGHADVDGAAEAVRFSQRYDDVLPSLNLAWSLDDDMLLRAAAARVITRPDLTDLSSKLTFNSSGEILTASGGNPALRPFEANQYDLTWEWYIDRASALVAGLFYKDIGTFIQTQLSNLEYGGQTYLLSSKVNGSNASVRGVELAWQQVFDTLPAPFDGLGMQVNYTWTDSRADYVDGGRRFSDRLEGVAQNTVNLVGFYEKGPFAARLSYNWHDDIVQAVGTADVATSNVARFGSLDGNVSWRFGERLSLYLNAINLTGQRQRLYVGDDLFAGYTDYGRSVSLGLRGRF